MKGSWGGARVKGGVKGAVSPSAAFRDLQAYASPSAAEGSAAALQAGSRGDHSRAPWTLSWSLHARVVGWSEAQDSLKELQVQQCYGGEFLQNGSTHNIREIYYRLMCPFRNTHACTWGCRIRIPKKDDAAEAVPVPVVDREKQHANHIIYIEVSGHAHTDHTSYQNKGAHMAFCCAAHHDNAMYNWGRKQIREWLEASRIECGQGELVNQTVFRIVQHCIHKRRTMLHDSMGVHAPTSAWAALTVFVSNMTLSVRQKQPDFTVDTAYLVPGSHLQHDEQRGCCLLLTTVNNILNLARMCHWYSPALPTAGVDHTHKVTSPPCPSLPTSIPSLYWPPSTSPNPPY